LVEFEAKVQQRHGVSIKDHVQFKNASKLCLKYLKKGDLKYYGQLDSNNKPRGFGIRINKKASITIAKWTEWGMDVGTYITILNDGRIWVCECYLNSKQEKKFRGTLYKIDGTSKVYDEGKQ